MKPVRFSLSLLVAALLFGATASAQDTGIPDTVRYEPNPATWTINSLSDTLFTIELWGFTDQNVNAASLGFRLSSSTGNGVGYHDTMIVADSFLFDADLDADFVAFNSTALHPDYGLEHAGYNGYLIGVLSFGPGQEGIFPIEVPTKIGDFRIKIIDPYELPEQFEIQIDSSFYPPAGAFKFSPYRRSTRYGYPPQFSPATIIVENSLGQPLVPTIGLSPDSLQFTATAGSSNPSPQILNIYNMGTGELDWTASDDVHWLTLSPVAGLGNGVCSLFVDISGLPLGVYEATVTVSDPAASNDPQSVQVTLNVVDQAPEIVLDPTYFYFEAEAGGDDPDWQVLSIYNGAKGDLNWTATDDADWLTLNPGSGTGNGSCTLSVSIAGMTIGDYTATITVSDPDAANSPQTASVDLSITQGPGPDGDFCGDPIVVVLPDQMPYSDENQYTCGRMDYYSETCLGYYDGGEDIIYEIHVTNSTAVSIILDPHGTTWTGIVFDDACPPDPSDCIAISTSSAGGVHGIDIFWLDPGTYYIMIDTWPAPDCIPSFDLHIHDVPVPTEGINCDIPIYVKLPNDLPYLDYSQTTCGKENSYSFTCLEYYDGGEDIIYEIDVITPTVVEIMMNPKGTTWSGIVIDDACPPDPEDCIAIVTGSSGDPRLISDLYLETGMYYIMIDTWPSPNCIPDFDLSIQGALPAPSLDYSPLSFDFGVVSEGDNGSDLLVMRNIGELDLEWDAEVSYSDLSPPEIEGAYISTIDDYIPGHTMDITLILQNDSQDAEWLNGATISFPAGVHVNSSTDFLVLSDPSHYLQYDGTTGDDMTVGWIDQDGGYGNIYSTETAEATVNITFDESLQGDMELAYTVSGDDWGGEPHDVSGILVLGQANPQENWLSVSPSSGTIAPGDSTLVSVDWNSSGLYNDTYESNIVLTHNGVSSVDIVPVTMTVVDGPAKAEFGDAYLYMYYMFAFTPIHSSVFVGNFNPPYTADDVVTATINGVTASVVGNAGPRPGFTGDVVELDVEIAGVLEQYGAPLDMTEQIFNVSGTFLDASSFDGNGRVSVFGKYSSDPERWIVPDDMVLLHGDVNNDALIDIDDVVGIVTFIFGGGGAPKPILIADCDCSDYIDIDDVVYLITFIFGGGPFPCHE